MSSVPSTTDLFNTTDDVALLSQMKIQSNNVWFNPKFSAYPEELKILVQCLNNLVLAPALSSSFAIPIQ